MWYHCFCLLCLCLFSCCQSTDYEGSSASCKQEILIAKLNKSLFVFQEFNLTYLVYALLCFPASLQECDEDCDDPCYDQEDD